MGYGYGLEQAREITIDDFDCGIFDENDLRLRVQSSRAIVNSDWPLVTLRGHVIITGADGSTLESNHVKWDTKKQSFTADGTYFLRRGDSRIAGKGIRVDSNLNIMNVKNAKLEKECGKMSRKTLVWAVLVVGCLTGVAAATINCQDNYTAGRTALFEGSLSGLREAYSDFDEAMQSPNLRQRQQLVFLHAVTRTAMLFIDNVPMRTAYYQYSKCVRSNHRRR